jgi:NAD(P)-dependent dehydrogenase (short-subunit alcohol dehydrogenase family)
MFTESLAGRSIVVTGASSGIGKRTSELLIAAGAKLIALDRNQPTFAVAQFIQVDLSNPESIDSALAALGPGPVDGLCNIAGVPGTVPDSVVARVNYLGLRRLTEGLLPRIRSGSAIVNIASVAGNKWRDHVNEYAELAQIQAWDEAVSWIEKQEFLKIEAYRRFKEALLVWSQAVGGEWTRKFGVRMNCVSPGPVDTPILNDFRASLGQKNVADLIDITGRPGTPDDIAPAVVFLLSESARWISGVELVADGGLGSIRFAESYRA